MVFPSNLATKHSNEKGNWLKHQWVLLVMTSKHSRTDFTAESSVKCYGTMPDIAIFTKVLRKENQTFLPHLLSRFLAAVLQQRNPLSRTMMPRLMCTFLWWHGKWQFYIRTSVPLPDSQHSNIVMLVLMNERVICGAKAKAILFGTFILRSIKFLSVCFWWWYRKSKCRNNKKKMFLRLQKSDFFYW